MHEYKPSMILVVKMMMVVSVMVVSEEKKVASGEISEDIRLNQMHLVKCGNSTAFIYIRYFLYL